MKNRLRDYYDQNTRRFLFLGGSRQTHTIHRAVYAPGVRTRGEALNDTNRRVLAEINRELAPPRDLHILDLGCGVGGSLIFLASTLGARMKGTGITLSPVQARLAQETATRMGAGHLCTFLEGDYLALPPLPLADLAFAIESFVLGPDPALFFQSASAALCPGGILIVCDDFQSQTPPGKMEDSDAEAWMRKFQKGWHADSLTTPGRVVELAAQAGLALMRDEDLTPWLRLNTFRDRWVALTVKAGRFLPIRRLLGDSYWGSLTGGNALQHSLTNGWIEYHFLVFRKVDISM